MKKLIFIILISLASKGFSQCTKVCVVGTVTVSPTAPTGTQTVYVTSSPVMDSIILQLKQSIDTLTNFYHSTFFGATNSGQLLRNIDLDLGNVASVNGTIETFNGNSAYSFPVNNIGNNNNRLHMQQSVQNGTSTTIVVTDPTISGRQVILLKTIILQVVNTSTTTAFVGSISDGSTVVIPVNVAPTISGLVQPNTYYLSTTFEEPVEFISNLSFTVVSGACTYNLTVIGWVQ